MDKAQLQDPSIDDEPIPTTLCNIAEELRCHILGFLSYGDIIHCALTCQSMYKTVKDSTQFQYLIELGAQRLIQVHPRPPTVSIAECLRIIRDKAYAWSSFKLGLTKRLRIAAFYEPYMSIIIAHQQLSFSSSKSLWPDEIRYKIIDLRTCTPEIASAHPCIWNNNTLNTVPGTSVCSTHMDETQDLVITVNRFNDNLSEPNFMYRINFRTISTDKEHPLAQGSCLVDSRIHFNEAARRCTAATILGDRLAFCCSAFKSNGRRVLKRWSLHVWNWHEGDQPDDMVYVSGRSYDLLEIRFVTKERLLALTSRANIELYNVEDLSKAPQLQARFMLPVTAPQSLRLRYSSVFHSAPSCARLSSLDERWIWTTNPTDRVICVMTSRPPSIFVIRAHLFFMDIPITWFDATSKDGRTVPWSMWGPQNSRCFQPRRIIYRLGVGGSRVVRAVETGLHMADFNPSAVARGIGKVVRNPTTFPKSTYHFTEDVTTHLPYVEVVNNDRPIDSTLRHIVMDEERVLIFRANTESVDVFPPDEHELMDVEIIDM